MFKDFIAKIALGFVSLISSAKRQEELKASLAQSVRNKFMMKIIVVTPFAEKEDIEALRNYIDGLHDFMLEAPTVYKSYMAAEAYITANMDEYQKITKNIEKSMLKAT